MAKILVIDDEVLVRNSMRMTLEMSGHQVVETDTGLEAVSLQHSSSFDLVITDIVMPDQEGLETIFQLKKEFPSLSVLAISGGGRGKSADYLDSAFRLGADQVLPKPFTNEELIECVDSCL